MDAGMHGALGAAAARLAVEASSRDRESVKGLSMVESLASVIRESRNGAMRRDALVSDLNTTDKRGHTTVQFNKKRDFLSFYLSFQLYRAPWDLPWAEHWRCCVEENPRWRHGCHCMPCWCLRYSGSEDSNMLCLFSLDMFDCLSCPIMQTTSMCFLSLTGLILRRCTLDAVGLASWESPTHIKCVSKNYETIQMLVSPENIP